MDIAYKSTADRETMDEALTAVQFFWQSILDSLSGAKRGEQPKPDMVKENKPIIDSLLTTMTMSLNSRTIQAEARDTILQIFTKNIGKKL